MSIVASVTVHDGIVIGADSMSQIMGRDSAGNVGFVQSYQHAQKLYQFSSRIGVATWGAGNVGPIHQELRRVRVIHPDKGTYTQTPTPTRRNETPRTG